MNSIDYNRVRSYFKAMCNVAREMDKLNMNLIDDPELYEEGSKEQQLASLRRYVNGEIARARETLLDDY